MIYVDHGLYCRALCTSKSIGMSSDAIESRLDSTRLEKSSSLQSKVSSAISYCEVAYRVLASNERPVNQQSQSPGQACVVKLDCAMVLWSAVRECGTRPSNCQLLPSSEGASGKH